MGARAWTETERDEAESGAPLRRDPRIVPGLRTPDQLLAVQRLAGNRAAAGMASPTVVQRKGGKKKGRNKRRNRNRGGPPPTQTPATPSAPPTTTPAASGGWFSGLAGYASSLWGATSITKEDDGDVEEIRGFKPSGEQSLFEAGEAEPEDDRGFLDKLIEIPQVKISLETEGDVGGGKGSMSGSVSGGASGGQAKGEIEWERALLEGEFAHKPIDLQVQGAQLTSKGTMFGGIKAGAEAEVSADGEGYASKGKLAAFAGVELTGETEVVMTVAGHEVKARGQLGLAVGLGGELSYWLTFQGGSLRWGSKGKAVLGAGGSWEYELVLPVASLSSTMWSWLSATGAAMWSGGATVVGYLQYLGVIT